MHIPGLSSLHPSFGAYAVLPPHRASTVLSAMQGPGLSVAHCCTSKTGSEHDQHTTPPTALHRMGGEQMGMVRQKPEDLGGHTDS